jgi:hypothetical protein
MKFSLCTLVATATLLVFAAPSPAQEVVTTTSPVSVVPHLIKYSGALPAAPGNASTVDVKFSLYAAQTGGEALWSETQQVSLDATGKYSVVLGSTTSAGVPDSVFANGQARWIGVTLGGEQESARTVLVATPYSLKASDAETLGGHPFSDFTLKNALPAGGTNITQINVGNGVTGGGTGPTVTLGLSSTYLENLGNEIYPQLTGTNTLTGKNTYTAGKLLLGTSPVLSAANVTGTSPVTATVSGNTVKIGLSDSALLTLGNGVYAQLGAANTFSKAQTFASGQTFPGTATLAGANTFSGSNTFSKAITFASGQTFPGTGDGTITGITTSSPLSGSGTSGSVALSLNTSSLETTLNGVYPQLSGTNTFSGSNTFSNPITFSSGQTFPGVPTLSGADAFTGLITMSGSTTSGAQFLVTNTESSAITGAYAAYGQMNGVGTGVFGIGANGVWGETNAGSTYTYSPAGVYGKVPSDFTVTDLDPIGVFGYNASVGSGVYGLGTSGNGVTGATSSGYGVEGTSTSGDGVYGEALDNVSAGVYGYALSTSSTGEGVLAEAASPMAYGVYAVAVAPSLRGSEFMPDRYGTGLWADTNQTYGDPGTFAALVATADDNYSGLFVNDSNSSTTLYLENDGVGGTGAAVPVMTAAGAGGACNINGSGDVTCSGRIKSAVPVAGGSGHVEVYSVQSSENWFEDFGSGQLFNGSAKVAIDPKFGQIVNTGVAYHVFLTPKGNCKGLFVTNEGANGFEVRELGDGGSSVEFDYRIVAKRSGHESERLVDATAEMRQMTQRRDATAARIAAGHRVVKRMPAMPARPVVRPLPSANGVHRTTTPGAHEQAAVIPDKAETATR